MTNTVTNQKSQTSYKAQKIISNVIIYAFLISLLLLSIVPFYLVVVNATHSSFDIVTKLNLLPGKNTLENYTTMQSHVNIWRGFLNSLCVAVPFTFFTGYFGASSIFFCLLYLYAVHLKPNCCVACFNCVRFTPSLPMCTTCPTSTISTSNP